jgi:DNA-binding NarL/FixJ family response regulator
VMPDMDGITATSEIKQRWPEIEVVAVASGLGQDEIGAALRAGAAGYLLKDADDGDVADAIRAAQRGEVHLDAAAARSLTDALRGLNTDAAALSPHERDVIVLIAGGGTNRQIAHHLGLSERTARTHVSSILARLGLLSRTQAAMWAVKEGLVSAHS